MLYIIKRMFQMYLLGKLFGIGSHKRHHGFRGHMPFGHGHAFLGGFAPHIFRKHRYHSKPSLLSRMLKKLF